MFDVGAFHTAQFGSLDYPSAAQALDHLLAADVERQVVREPVIAHRKRGQHGRFVGALVWVFEDHHLVELASWATYATYCCDEHQPQQLFAHALAPIVFTFNTFIRRGLLFLLLVLYPTSTCQSRV